MYFCFLPGTRPLIIIVFRMLNLAKFFMKCAVVKWSRPVKFPSNNITGLLIQHPYLLDWQGRISSGLLICKQFKPSGQTLKQHFNGSKNKETSMGKDLWSITTKVHTD